MMHNRQSDSDRTISGKYFLFVWNWLISFTWFSLWLQSRTLCPLSAKTIARAVPQLPAPTTVIVLHSAHLNSPTFIFFLLQIFLLVCPQNQMHLEFDFQENVHKRNAAIPVH